MATAQIVQLAPHRNTRIINRYLELVQQLAKVKTELAMLKVEAIEILGEGLHESKSGRVLINWTTRPVFDLVKAKTFMTREQIAACQSSPGCYDVRVKSR